MTTDRDDTLLRAAYAPARALEPSEAEIAAVLARVEATRGRDRDRAAATRGRAAARGGARRPSLTWGRPIAIGLAALLLVVAALYSVPATRAALEGAGESVGGVFSGWASGDSTDAPGTALHAGDGGAEFLYDQSFAKEPRVIAAAGGYKLFAYIGVSGGINFELGNTGIAMGFESAEELGKEALQVLGPGAMKHADPQGHVPLFGIAAREVKTVELTYETGPPLVVEGVEGGFVLLAEPARGPLEVLARGAEGEVLGRQPVDDSPHPGVRIDWGQYLRP